VFVVDSIFIFCASRAHVRVDGEVLGLEDGDFDGHVAVFGLDEEEVLGLDDGDVLGDVEGLGVGLLVGSFEIVGAGVEGGVKGFIDDDGAGDNDGAQPSDSIGVRLWEHSLLPRQRQSLWHAKSALQLLCPISLADMLGCKFRRNSVPDSEFFGAGMIQLRFRLFTSF
jgi:hypothetical protein